MDTLPRRHESPYTSLLPSPTSHSTTSSSSSDTNSPTHGLQQTHNNNLTPTHPPTPPTNPITRSESTNPYPTTFVQSDTTNFKNVVQMLTGSSETAKNASSKPASNTQHQPDPSPRNHTHSIPPIKSIPMKQHSGFKLYERRNSLKNFKISPLNPFFNPNNSGFSPRKPEILSPSILDFPALVLSPVTPLIPDPFDRSGFVNFNCTNVNNVKLDAGAEEKAIKEKGFYLHRSPATTPRGSEPRLLPLFPETSPRVPGGTEDCIEWKHEKVKVGRVCGTCDDERKEQKRKE
ncbi:VQ motif-containing protein [Tripterygium wilfordii]|uniref:VQ motif-containing protein n=1 Tax=Tripterygium wilfordii TaxID=458696 RepID=A0A7J7D7D6_TRIWF|nr:VQ motif-containing protein 4-like isoform X2 [Tripterygium wilfordii]KAF5742285.1 VQ motif-containing protein [Tripterygium wilfordii]